MNKDKNVKLKCLKIPIFKSQGFEIDEKHNQKNEARMSNYCLFHERRQEIHGKWKDDG